MAVPVLEYILLVAFLTSTPIYVILLVTFHRFRRKEPFNTSFFSISFSVGIFDLLHLLDDWLLSHFANYGWFGINKLVLTAPTVFAKITSFVWWFAGLGQTLGVFLLALNRMAVIGYRMVRMESIPLSTYNLLPEWTKKQGRLVLLANWFIPLALTLPQAWMHFDYHNINGTDGVVLYWVNNDFQLFYYYACFVWCGVLAVLSTACYSVAYYKTRKHYTMLKKTIKGERKQKAELKLAVAGVVLCALTGVYAVYCGSMALVTDVQMLSTMLRFQYLMGDAYSWVNAYLLLGCSSSVRKHFKATLFCTKTNLVDTIIVREIKKRNKN